MPHRRRVLAALALLPMLLVAPPAAADSESARNFVQTVAGDAVAIAADQATPLSQRLDQYDALFRQHFALPQISRFVLGRYWRGASEDEQRRFIELFSEWTVLTWAERFEGYSGETVETGRVAPDGEAGWFVESIIQRPDEPPVTAVWRLRETDDGFKIVDMIVEGTSMAITQRSDYASRIRNAGGLQPLMAEMEQRVDRKRRNLLG